MFSDEEMALMRSLGLDCDFNSLSEDDDRWADIEEKVGDFQSRSLNGARTCFACRSERRLAGSVGFDPRVACLCHRGHGGPQAG